jgi:hypothetical protein
MPLCNVADRSGVRGARGRTRGEAQHLLSFLLFVLYDLGVSRQLILNFSVTRLEEEMTDRVSTVKPADRWAADSYSCVVERRHVSRYIRGRSLLRCVVLYLIWLLRLYFSSGIELFYFESRYKVISGSFFFFKKKVITGSVAT